MGLNPLNLRSDQDISSLKKYNDKKTSDKNKDRYHLGNC